MSNLNAKQLPQSVSIFAQLPLKEIIFFWFLLSIAFAFMGWAKLDVSLQSPDNAMRLVQIRAFLNGAPWFDPFEPRLNPPEGYITHWSRLIDVGIAALIYAFRQFTSLELAEKLARTVWPLLLMLPAMIATCAIGLRLSEPYAGQQTSKTTLILTVGAVIVSPMFRPGEIDHHNAQLVCVLIMISAILWADRCLKSAVLAGVTGGLLLALGLEYAYIFVCTFAALALMTFYDSHWRRPSVYTFLALGISTPIFWLSTTPTALRFAPVCDALSINIALPVAVMGIGIALLMMIPKLSTYQRFGGVLIIAILAALTFYSFDPRCIKGPYGTLDPRLFSLWLDDVDEVQSLMALLKTRTSLAFIAFIFPFSVAIAMLVYGYALIRNAFNHPHESPFPRVITLVLFLIAFIGVILQVRIETLAMWLGVPLAATCIDHVLSRHPRRDIRTLIVALAWNPVFMIGLVVIIAGFSTQKPVDSANEKSPVACADDIYMRGLAKLPVGIVLGPRDLGSALLLQTPHNVISAPYHRIGKAILFTSDVHNSSVSEAYKKIKEANITYLVECTGYLSLATPEQKSQATLRMALLFDQPVPWLERLDVQSDVIKVWRVK